MALETLRIFISSPGDVAEERLIARRVIGRLDAQFGDLLHLEAMFWEHQPLAATASFQAQLLRPSDTDIVIAILWSRLGTALPGSMTRADGSTYASGTEFEFEDAVAAHQRSGKPDIVAYRKTAPAALPVDAVLLDEHVRQRRELDRFVDRWFGRDADGSFKAAFHPFASPADFEDLLEAHLTRLVEPRLPARSGAWPVAAVWRDGSPFRGLAPFEPQHAQVFFGRTGAVAEVLMKLRRQAERRRAFVLVVGASGGGKSSLVRAGVLPLLVQAGVVGEATQWRHATLRPSDGQGQLDAVLAAALAQETALPALLQGGALDLADADAKDLAAAVVRALDAIGPACDLALVVDQLEELFSDPRIGKADRERFVDRLDALARSGRVWLLATVRSDIYPRLNELPVLMALKEGEGQFDLRPPSVHEIGQIIRLPAAAAGLRFEQRATSGERLDETIRDAAAKNLGALPLLQFLLEALYQRRNAENVLTFRAYEELGGVEGALARRAEAVLAGVGPAARAALPLVLRELVTFGDDESRALRRVAPRDAFAEPAANELVDALLEARLLVSGLDDAGQPTVQLAHEALIEFWPRLRQWREQNRELLALHSRLAAAARAWERQQRRSDFLLARGKPLEDAQSLVEAGLRLGASETALVDASRRRARQFVGLRAGAVLSLAVLTVVATVSAHRAGVESDRARTQATTAQRTTDFMVGLFAVADPEENRGEKLTVREMLDRGVAEVQSGLKDEQVVRANLLRAMGQAYNGLGLYPKAFEVLQDAVVEAERSGNASTALRAHLALAANRYADAACDVAEPLFRRALADARRLYVADPTISEAVVGIADCLVDKGAYVDAEALYREALALDLRLHGESHSATARSISTLATVLYKQGKYAEAEPLFRRALTIRRSLFGARHPGVVVSLNNLGSFYFQTGRYDEATDVWSEALMASRAVFGAEHHDVAMVLNNLGRVDLIRGRSDLAERRITESIAMDRRLLAPNHPDSVMPINSLAMINMERGDVEAAETLLRQALVTARPASHWMLDQILANLADVCIATGRSDEARAALNEARTLLEKRFGEALNHDESWRSALLNGTAASLAVQERRFVDAENLLRSAAPIIEKRFGPTGFFPEQMRRRYADLRASWGRPRESVRTRSPVPT